MTNDEAKALGLRALAAGFDPSPPSLLAGLRSREGVLWAGPMGGRREEWWPDLRDAATRGVLLERVREVWGDPRLCTVYTAPEEDDNDWSAVLLDYDDDFNLHGVEHVGIGRTEAEALVCALEAALEAGQGGEG